MSARPRPARAQGLVALGAVVVIASTLVGLDRAGPRPPSQPAVGVARSGAWICPHGGDDGWTATLFLANPGPDPVAARVSRLHADEVEPQTLEVPPESSVRLDLAAEERASSTYVEYFGGWIGAGWVLSGSDGGGSAAEPCAPDAARRWYLPDGSTRQGERSYVVVANPFDVAAVLDVVIFTADLAPIRNSEWTDLVVPARRGIALLLNSKIEGEPAVAVRLDVSVGRVAASSLGVIDRTRLRGAIGSTETSEHTVLPVTGGSDQAEVLLLSTADRTIRFGATVLSEDAPRPAGGLTEQEHLPTAAAAYAVPLEGGPSGVDVFVLDGASAAAALRVLGPAEDPGASGGVTGAATEWVLLPAAASAPSAPGAVLVNPGDEEVAVTLTILLREGGTAPAPVTVTVPPHAAAAVPPEFLEAAPGSAILVRSDGAGIVALSEATSGADLDEAYALSTGVPVPHQP